MTLRHGYNHALFNIAILLPGCSHSFFFLCLHIRAHTRRIVLAGSRALGKGRNATGDAFIMPREISLRLQHFQFRVTRLYGLCISAPIYLLIIAEIAIRSPVV